jgi:hypothetical protein
VDAVAVPVDDGDVCVMCELVEEGGDGGGVGEDGVPVPEREIRRDENGPGRGLVGSWAFVASVDDLVEQVCGMGVVGEVADLVDLCGAPHKSTYVESLVMWSSSRKLRSLTPLGSIDST